MVCFRYIIVNTLHKGDNKDDDDDNNNNNNESQINRICVGEDQSVSDKLCQHGNGFLRYIKENNFFTS
jgi:hypothetical protein